jgi:hypothetical protein
LDANVIHAAQTAIWTTNAATTIQMSGIGLAARSVLFAVLILFLLLFVPVPALVLVIRPQKFDVPFKVEMSADVLDPDLEAEGPFVVAPGQLQNQRLHDLA